MIFTKTNDDVIVKADILFIDASHDIKLEIETYVINREKTFKKSILI